ncbi:MAG: YceI family protein [Acidobacteriota bacterium]
MKLILGIVAGFALLIPGLPPPANLYKIDLTQSTVGVTIFQEGFLKRMRPSHAIEVKSFTGWVSYTPGKEAQASAELIAEAKSLVNAEKEIGEVEKREFESALRNAVLEAPKYPQIVFRSTSIADLKRNPKGHTFTLHGDLTMHGVKRRIAIPVSVEVSGKQLIATGAIDFKQTDFEMKPYEAAFGLIKIRDDAKVTFSIVARAS